RTHSMFYLRRPGTHRALPSFPTRRSSDLGAAQGRAPEGPYLRPLSVVGLEALALLHRLAFEQFGVDGQEAGEPCRDATHDFGERSEEHTSELQSRVDLVCRLLLEKKNEDI